MTPSQYRAALERLGLTQDAAADLLGYSLTSANQWANGRSEVPKLVSTVLRALVNGKLKPEDVK